MKKFFHLLTLVLALGLVVGCSTSETSVIEGEVAAEDDTFAEENLDDYDSDEYAKGMAAENARK